MCTTLDSMKTDASTLNKFHTPINGPRFGILSAASVNTTDITASYIIFFIISYNMPRELFLATYAPNIHPKCQVNRIEF